MVAAKDIEKKVQGLKTDLIFTITDLGFPASWYDNVRIKLSRMEEKGVIVKVGKGRYYKPKQTMFGSLQPRQEDLVKDLLIKDGKIIGYLTGYAIWNRMGLTTQISSIIEIGSNIHRNKTKRGTYTIRFVLQPNIISHTNIPLLQILDAIKQIKTIPDTQIESSVIRLSLIINDLAEKEISMLATLALRYTPQTRALLGAILEMYNRKDAANKLKRTLNPATTYKIGISDRNLPNKKNWNIK